MPKNEFLDLGLDDLITKLEEAPLADARLNHAISWLELKKEARAIERDGERHVMDRGKVVPFETWIKDNHTLYTGSLDAAVSLYREIPKKIPSSPILCCADALIQRRPAGIFRILKDLRK